MKAINLLHLGVPDPRVQTVSNKTQSQTNEILYNIYMILCQSKNKTYDILLTTSDSVFPNNKSTWNSMIRLITFNIVLVMNISFWHFYSRLNTLTGKSMTKFILEIGNQDGFWDISGLYTGSIQIRLLVPYIYYKTIMYLIKQKFKFTRLYLFHNRFWPHVFFNN